MKKLSSKGANGKAHTVKKTFSRTTSVRVEILADPSIIWALLTNAADFPRWNSTIISLEGMIQTGQAIKLKSTLAPDRIFKIKVKEMIPEKRMVWGDAMGQRTFTLEPSGKGVVFDMTETMGSVMFPLFASKIPPFDESFEQFAGDLKREAELISRSQ